MAIFQGTDGYLTFGIQADEANKDVFLLSFSDYIELLNPKELANSLVNKVGLVTTPDIAGSFVKMSSDKLNIIPGLEFNPLIYRGQNKDYDFIPSAYRYELSSGEERLRHSLNWIKKREFVDLFKSTPYYSRMKNFNVLNCTYDFDTEAVAQSYNYSTNRLDVTRNMMVAYFFAYTYIDYETGRFMPIEDFETYTPMLYVGNIAEIYQQMPQVIENTGLQLLLRSKAQDTISLDLTNVQRVKDLFTKIELPKNLSVSRNVYAMFKGGEVLFPSDYLSRCATQVRNHKTLQQVLIDMYCAETGTDKKWLIKEFKSMGYEIIDKSWNIPEQARYMVNREIDDLILPYINNAIAYRGCTKKQNSTANIAS